MTACKGNNRSTVLANALYNYSPSSGASDEYCKGLIVGVASALMSVDLYSFDVAMAWIVRHMPDDCRELNESNVPTTWLPFFA